MFSSNTTQVSDGGYQISRSLRFNSADTAYLTRTPASASNRKTWTWSAWVKRGAMDRASRYTLFASRPTANPYTLFYFSGSTQSNRYGLRFEDSSADLATTQVFRDPSAWYHIVLAVDTTQATASNRIKMYVNGSQITVFSTASYPSQNTDMLINNTTEQCIGDNTYDVSTEAYDGYMTEVNFIDGQALTPSSFGETNAQTGVWQPKAYSGSYGTNGFYLNFSDNSNTTAATLGKDYSGNGNNWTPNNFSVTAGAGNDSLVDSPTSYGTDTGVGGTVRGNYCTMNPLQLKLATLTNGNLTYSAGSSSGNNYPCGSTLGVSTGQYYWEINVTSLSAYLGIGIASASDLGTLVINNSPIGFSASSYSVFESGSKCNNSSSSAYQTGGYATGNVVGVAFDATNGKIWFSKNGVFPNSGDPAAGTNAAFTSISANTYLPALSGFDNTLNANFGQRPFAYTAPSGFKALCTQNLPTPTIGATTATQAGKYFNPVLYTGTGSSLGVTGVGFQPDWVWLKNRSAGNNHQLFDAVRGVQKAIYSDLTLAEATNANALTAFGSDGFTLGSESGINGSGSSYVSWNWKANGAGSTNTAGSITSTVSANTTSGFSIVTFTIPASGVSTVGHGLGVAPSMMLLKRRDGVYQWLVYHASLGNNSYLVLNDTLASQTAATLWNSTTPTSTVFTLGTAWPANLPNATMVAYCFAPIAGYSAFGSYTGNGSTDGPFVYTGFRPAYVLIKGTSSGATATSWAVFDSKRNTYNLVDNYLLPNDSGAESQNSTVLSVDFLSNGFKVRSSSSSFGINQTSNVYVYACFAENPFKYSLAR